MQENTGCNQSATGSELEEIWPSKFMVEPFVGELLHRDSSARQSLKRHIRRKMTDMRTRCQQERMIPNSVRLIYRTLAEQIARLRDGLGSCDRRDEAPVVNCVEMTNRLNYELEHVINDCERICRTNRGRRVNSEQGSEVSSRRRNKGKHVSNRTCSDSSEDTNSKVSHSSTPISDLIGENPISILPYRLTHTQRDGLQFARSLGGDSDCYSEHHSKPHSYRMDSGGGGGN